MAFRVATEQFFTRAVSRTRDRSGILIFVSLAEHYARIIADDGIAARVPQSHWQGAVDALIAHTREGRVADGFIAAIDLCGAVLAEHFPQTGDDDPNELARPHLFHLTRSRPRPFTRPSLFLRPPVSNERHEVL